MVLQIVIMIEFPIIKGGNKNKEPIYFKKFHLFVYDNPTLVAQKPLFNLKNWRLAFFVKNSLK